MQYANKFGKLRDHRTGKVKFSFHFQREGRAKECTNYCTIALISHASKMMAQNPLSYSSTVCEPRTSIGTIGFRKCRGTRDQIANIHWIIKKARAFQKNIYFCFTDYTKAFVYVDHNKLWKILRDWRTRDQLANIH